MAAIVVLGMHRSGTSCLAGMLAAAGAASAGPAVRNWDNARGHFEALAAVRLNDAVLAASGGHWLSPPAMVRWDETQAQERDRLLRTPVDGRPALLKDPRTLLTLPFWRAAEVPFHSIGIFRHPLAVARSLHAWRDMPLADGVALWLAHNRVLADDQERHGYPLIGFDHDVAGVITAVARACARLGLSADHAALAAACDERLVHHDHDEAPTLAHLPAALELYARLVARTSGGAVVPRRQRFPRAALASFEGHLAAGHLDEALAAATQALAACADPAAVLVPVVTALVRQRVCAAALRLIEGQQARITPDLAHLLRGKVLLAAGDADQAAEELLAACAVAQPFFQARHLLPHALYQAGRLAEARAALAGVAAQALYPHGPFATLAEWSRLAGEHTLALRQMEEAIAQAPRHRRGRLRTRCAEWLRDAGEIAAARAHLEQALVEDPAYGRVAEVLRTLTPV